MTAESSTPSALDRIVLEEVPKVGFYDGTRCPEDFPLPSCIRAYLEYAGDSCGCKYVPSVDPAWQCGCAYAYLMGVSGAAFFLSWQPGWTGDNLDIRFMSDDSDAPIVRAMDATGYAYDLVRRRGRGDDEARFRRCIVESIAAHGNPVLALGVVGPPACCLITGYDQRGDVLLGWSFFQAFPEFAAGLEFEENGYFRKRDWFSSTESLIVIGDRSGRSSRKETDRAALEWALQVMHTPLVGDGRRNGLAAFSAWADHLLRDEDFRTEDMSVLWDCFNTHDDAVGALAEARWYGSLFLAQLAQDAHDWRMSEHLYQAAACFAAEHALMWQVWDAVGGIGRSEEKARRFAAPEVRRAIAPIILRAQVQDARAAEQIERSLALA